MAHGVKYIGSHLVTERSAQQNFDIKFRKHLHDVRTWLTASERSAIHGSHPLFSLKIQTVFESLCPVDSLIDKIRRTESRSTRVVLWRNVVENSFLRFLILPYVIAMITLTLSARATYDAFVESVSTSSGLDSRGLDNDFLGMCFAESTFPDLWNTEKQLETESFIKSVHKIAKHAFEISGSNAQRRSERETGSNGYLDLSCGEIDPTRLQSFVSSREVMIFIDHLRRDFENKLFENQEQDNLAGACIKNQDKSTFSLLMEALENKPTQKHFLRQLCATASLREVLLSLTDEMYLTKGKELIGKAVAQTQSYNNQTDEARLVHIAVALVVPLSSESSQFLVDFPPLEDFFNHLGSSAKRLPKHG